VTEGLRNDETPVFIGGSAKALCRTRTDDPFLTMVGLQTT
jgi:hypothetical protein